MKKLLPLVLILALLLSACGNGGEPAPGPDEPGDGPGISEPGPDEPVPGEPEPGEPEPSEPAPGEPDPGEPSEPSEPGGGEGQVQPTEPVDPSPLDVPVLPAPDYFDDPAFYDGVGDIRITAAVSYENVLQALGYAGLLTRKGFELTGAEQAGDQPGAGCTLRYSVKGGEVSNVEGYDSPVVLELNVMPRGLSMTVLLGDGVTVANIQDPPVDDSENLALRQELQDLIDAMYPGVALPEVPEIDPDLVLGQPEDQVVLPAPDNFNAYVRYDSMGLPFFMATLSEEDIPQAQGYLGLILNSGDFELVDHPEGGFDASAVCDYRFAYTGEEDVRDIPGDSAITASFYPENGYITFTVVYGLGIRLEHGMVPANDGVSAKLWDALLASAADGTAHRAQLEPGDLVDADAFICGTCGGDGDCGTCGGDGRLYAPDTFSETAPCPACGFTGNCPACDGTGRACGEL